jgi:RNA polymerase sigma-70 factor, ECF subfamily
MKTNGASPTSEATGPESGSRPPDLNPEGWVELHCDDLYRYALARVRDPETAKDLVQETFLAAWRSSERFAGQASERTWLTRILRNKIVDHYRKRRPEFAVEDELTGLEEKQFERAGLHQGGWTSSNAPASWKDATQCLEESEFWIVLQQCTDKLPAKVANVFLLREVDGRSYEEICSTLGMNRNHLGVLLHRARLALRRCLELHWFKESA